MSAVDDLREAAQLLRERAGRATRGPWLRAADHDVARGQFRDNEVGFWGGEYAAQVTSTGDGDEAKADAVYIASMYPGVGLALARAFEARCVVYEIRPLRDRESFASDDALLAVARIYLGRST